MPPPETANRTEWAVLWESKLGTREAPVDEYGEVVINEPVELKVRWEDSRRNALEPQGMIQLASQVFVDRRIKINSIMWRGRLDDWLGTGSALDDAELMQVVSFEEIPDLKGRALYRSVGLIKYKSALPTVG